ncbi:uncharacterized protein UTRI_10447_B [Ustilago trichophora]|uniref:TRIP4/RQT4 C2HC5-type zinc finger domain-containing protein n=1 Tax=Ustilago trichophora TaxID=86804 RepID=A0A5C3E8V0_9BASI|nr:uncharacterized protein UTRI_10447_B [Ustilago trichophora]
MAKNSSIWIDQLVSLLGLDKETVKTQVLPFLDSFDDQVSLQTHLQGLVGTDTPLAKSFVRDFTRSRFPQQAASTSANASASTTPTLSAAPASSSAGQRKRGKKTLAERAGIGQTLAPRKLEDTGLDEEEQMAKLAEAFGGMGTVYRKKQDEEDFFAGSGRGKKAKQSGARSGPAVESSHTPQEQPNVAAAAPIVNPDQAAASQLHSVESEDPSTSQAKPSQPAPPPTTEMLAIDAVVTELTSTSTRSSSSSASINDRKLCFCQGRRHPLAPYAPLCYKCGLILCSAIHPSPLSPLSSCPSCSCTPLLGAAARSDLISKLTSEREILFEQQLLQIQLQREQKKLNKASARSAREEEAALFPKLGVEASTASVGNAMHAGPVVGKHGALQKAKAIAGDAQRTAKVLSLDMKTHKVKSHVKVAKAKPVAVVKEKETPEESEMGQAVDQDPFTALDGSPLVKDEKDDGLRVRSLGAGAGGKKAGKGGKAIPSRTWTFSGKPLTLGPTVAVR